MSTEKQTNVSIASRLVSLIDLHTNGNLKRFAEIAGINPVTLLNYSKGRLPKADALANICESFGVNINWLLTGKGTQYIQANDSKSLHADLAPELSDFLEKAKMILDKGDAAAQDTLKKNLTQMIDRLDAETEVEKLRREMTDIKNELAEMKNKMEYRANNREEKSSKKKVA